MISSSDLDGSTEDTFDIWVAITPRIEWDLPWSPGGESGKCDASVDFHVRTARRATIIESLYSEVCT